MSKTITIEVYSIKELPEKVQQKVYYEWLSNVVYPWADDNRETLEAFENIFPIKVKDWEYGGYNNNYIHFEMTCEPEIEELRGIRLLAYLYNNYFDYLFKGKYYSISKYINGKYQYKSRRSKVIKENSCVLTGYCIDDDILKPVYDFLKKPDNRTFYDLMKECLESWLTACNNDYEYCTSFEYFIEEAENNDYTYTIDGKMI